MRAAVITSGVVSNIIEVETLATFAGLVDARSASIGDTYSNGVFARPLPVRADVLAEKWTAIKSQRDHRQKVGVKVGADWFHSDADSRTQQLGMVVAGANLPAGMQWKTLTRTGSVFVTMTPSLAGSIFQAVMASDSAIFGAAEKHRKALEASATPETYNVLIGWPVSFEDAT